MRLKILVDAIRYGQIAVPDFIDFLCTRVPKVNQSLSFRYFTRLQCSKCKWLSEIPTNDASLKLYIPTGWTKASLAQLVQYISRSTLRGSEAVICGNCKIKTEHTSSRYSDPDVFMIEIIRVTEVKQRWTKRTIPISFPCPVWNYMVFRDATKWLVLVTIAVLSPADTGLPRN